MPSDTPPTLDQLRDELAGLLGWRQDVDGRWMDDKEIHEQPFHPIPATLDGIAELEKEHAKGWNWMRTKNSATGDLSLVWVAFDGKRVWNPKRHQMAWRKIIAPDTGDERRDRLALLVAIVKAKQ